MTFETEARGTVEAGVSQGESQGRARVIQEAHEQLCGLRRGQVPQCGGCRRGNRWVLITQQRLELADIARVTLPSHSGDDTDFGGAAEPRQGLTQRFTRLGVG